MIKFLLVKFILCIIVVIEIVFCKHLIVDLDPTWFTSVNETGLSQVGIRRLAATIARCLPWCETWMRLTIIVTPQSSALDMQPSRILAAANRLRIASAILSDPADAEIVIRYVKDLEALARREVEAPPAVAREQITDQAAVITDFLKVAYALDVGDKFQDLLDQLDRASNRPN